MSELNLSYYGIGQEETIESGEIRKIFVDPIIPYTSNKPDYPLNLYYQIYIQEGQSKIISIDWTKLNRGSNDYFFTLDTTWMIPNMFYIDIKYEYKSETRKILNPIKFRIVNKIVNPGR